MWKLTIEDDEGKPTSLPLVHDEYTLGRGETNAIRLTDRNVSRKHAILKKNGTSWLLADLQSYNGTFVNNERVVGDRSVLSNDVMMLGDYRLILTDETLSPSTDPSKPGGPALPVQYRPNRLVIVVGPAPGTEFPLDKDHFTIGRSEEATISINHSSVSRIHAELIALGGGRYEIIDKGSANGIRVNGVELKRGILEAGDALELGDVRLRFVGAGKVFRSNTDTSTQLPAVHAPGGDAAPRPALSTGKIVGILLAVLALIVFVVFLLVRPGKTNSGTGTGSGHVVKAGSEEDNGPALLEEAKKLLEEGKIEEAHKKAHEIPEGSAAFEGDSLKQVKSIEKAWAEQIFKKVDEAKTNDEKRALLKQVPPDTQADKEDREKAINLIGTLPPEPTATPVGGGPLPGVGPGVSTGAPPPTTTEPTTTKSASAAPTTTQAPANPSGIDENAIRKGLEGKVWSGKATLEEMRMLKAICSHQGDRACRDRAGAMIKQKMEQQQK